jgi:membrane fusion protein (multidrug efflux system)
MALSDPNAAGDTEAGTAVDARKRKPLFMALGAVVVAAGLGYGAYEWLIGSRYVSTDNAYVAAEIAQVTPLIAGPVTSVRVVDTQNVKRGDVLVTLDHADARIAVAEAEAELARAERRINQTVATSGSLAAQVTAREADIARARAGVAEARSALSKAKIDLDRRKALGSSGAVSGEELTAATNAFDAARANFAAAEAALAQAVSSRATAQGQLAANEALVRGTTVETNPEVRAARARLDAARLALARTVIRAPVDGVVARRQVQVGQRVAPGVPLMTIVPLSQLYVDANFKEGQLARVRPGQPVELTSDLYGGDVVYRGRVAGFAGGTGAAFALIPAQNASGNWIKVVQRLPVRVTLDPRQLAEHPLRVGLSMEATVDTTER